MGAGGASVTNRRPLERKYEPNGAGPLELLTTGLASVPSELTRKTLTRIGGQFRDGKQAAARIENDAGRLRVRRAEGVGRIRDSGQRSVIADAEPGNIGGVIVGDVADVSDIQQAAVTFPGSWAAVRRRVWYRQRSANRRC